MKAWLDRITAPIAPVWTLRRQRARIAADMLIRHYEAAQAGRRTAGWKRSGGDANAVVGGALGTLRASARDLVRNNPYAESALGTIADHTVGWGIVAKPRNGDKRSAEEWRRWAESKDCDADGRHDFYGLQKLVMRTVAESGEVIVRRRLRSLTDGFRVPMQLQVLDPDFIDTTKDTSTLPAGQSRIIQGVQFDGIGRRTGYWLYKEHPGALAGGFPTSQFVPAESVLHIFRPNRPGQVRGLTWFAPVILQLKDLDEFEDATLVKQKIAACLAVLTTDTDGLAPALGTVDTTVPRADQTVDYLEPGLIKTIAPGQDVKVVNPPDAGDYDVVTKNVQRAVATGLGITYEDMTGDYTKMPFSAARMSRLRHQDRVYDWRWRIVIPQFCDPVWGWFQESAAVMNLVGSVTEASWTPPPLASVDPEKEGIASQRQIRNGLKTWSEVIRESGQDPDEVAAELAADFKRFDDLGLVLDCDPRQLTANGQAQSTSASAGDGDQREDDGADNAEDQERRIRNVRALVESVLAEVDRLDG